MSEPRPRPEPCCGGRWVAASLAWRCWVCTRGPLEVSRVLGRGARPWTLATRAKSPPTTWEEARLSSLSHLVPHLPCPPG